MQVVEGIVHEHDFKSLCDGLLRAEVSPFVQTFDGKGGDGGIDAEYVGPYGGREGRTVFQYKFVGPDVGQVKGRQRLIEALTKEKDNVRNLRPRPTAYVAITNVAVKPETVDKIGRALRLVLRNAKFVVWDRASLNAMLKGRGYLARSWDGRKERHCLAEIIRPLHEWFQAAATIDSPLWTTALVDTKTRRPTTTFMNPFEWTFGWELHDNVDPVREIVKHPLYEYAAGVAFPSGLEGVVVAIDEAARLNRSVAQTVRDLATTFLSSDAFAALPEGERERCALPLAFCVLEAAWVPAQVQELSVVDTSRGVFIGRTAAYQGPVGNQLLPFLDEEVRRLREAGPPSAMLRARAQLQKRLRDCADRTWWPAVLQVDYHGTSTTEATSRRRTPSTSRSQSSAGMRHRS